jgi:hypothetical protein
LAIGLAFAYVRLSATFPATIVILSDVEISDAGIVLGGNPPVQRLGMARSRSRFIAWDVDLADGSGMFSPIILSWKGPDGLARRLEAELVHPDKLPRCVHVLRLDANADPMRIFPPGQPDDRINAACR